MEELGDQCKVVFAYFVTGNTMEELGDQCRVVFAFLVTGNTMEELGDQCRVVFAYFVPGDTMAPVYPNEWAWEDDEQVLHISTCCNCPSYNPPTPWLVHRVDAKTSVFIERDSSHLFSVHNNTFSLEQVLRPRGKYSSNFFTRLKLPARFQSQHLSTQWNRRGGKWNNVEYST